VYFPEKKCYSTNPSGLGDRCQPSRGANSTLSMNVLTNMRTWWVYNLVASEPMIQGAPAEEKLRLRNKITFYSFTYIWKTKSIGYKTNLNSREYYTSMNKNIKIRLAYNLTEFFFLAS
jgi:hypothetical protein